MKGLIWNEDSKLELAECKEPGIINDDEVKIKIKYTGICGTDLQILKGNETIPPNIILGHEAIGEIVELGKAVTYFKIGDMVIIDPNQYCGECYYCKKGLTNFCENDQGLKIAGINRNGTFAEYFVCEQRFIYKIPKEMSLLSAVLIEPLACVLNNIRAASIRESDAVLILGSGPMGVLCQMICKNISKLVVATENSQIRQKMASAYNDYIYSSEELTLDEIYKINQNRKFDVIIDTVGTQMENALKLAEKNARIIPMGMNKNYAFSLNPIYLISNGLKLIGASEYNMLFTDTISSALRYKELDNLVTKRYSIEKYKEAFESVLGFDLETHETKEITQLKVVFEF